MKKDAFKTQKFIVYPARASSLVGPHRHVKEEPKKRKNRSRRRIAAAEDVHVTRTEGGRLVGELDGKQQTLLTLWG